ncbi:MAG TPA: hypothetical protein VGJ89_06155 [Geothrix sp.]|jgi:hypothetical protein
MSRPPVAFKVTPRLGTLVQAQFSRTGTLASLQMAEAGRDKLIQARRAQKPEGERP